MWAYAKAHPQRTSALLLVIFTQVQGSLALAQFPIPPLVLWAINTAFGVVMAILAFNVKNLKDEGSDVPPATE